MLTNDLDRLAALIRRERDGLLLRWREQVIGLPSAQRGATGTLLEGSLTKLRELMDRSLPAKS